MNYFYYRYLLSQMENIPIISKYFDAIQQGSTEKLKQLIPKFIKQFNQNGLTGLMYAAKYNQIECIKLLLPYEKFLNTQENLTALMVAVINNNLDSVKLLVQHQSGQRLTWNIDIQSQTFQSLISKELNIIPLHLRKGMTALTIAIQLGNLEIAKYLFQFEQTQSDISNLSKQLYLQEQFIDTSSITQYNLKCDILNRNPLFYLILSPQKSKQYTQLIQIILKNLQQQSVYDTFGLTPLHYAIILQDIDGITLLYDKYRAYKTSSTCKWIGSSLSCQELASKLGFQLIKQKLSELEQIYQNKHYGFGDLQSKFEQHQQLTVQQTVNQAKSQLEQLEQQLSQINEQQQVQDQTNNMSISSTQQSYDFSNVQQFVQPVTVLQSYHELAQSQPIQEDKQQTYQIQEEQIEEEQIEEKVQQQNEQQDIQDSIQQSQQQNKLKISDLRLNTVINQELLNSHINQGENKMNAALIEEKMDLLNQNAELQQKLLKQQQNQLQAEQKYMELQSELIGLKTQIQTQQTQIQKLEVENQQIQILQTEINQQKTEYNNLMLVNKQQTDYIEEIEQNNTNLQQQIDLLQQNIKTHQQQIQEQNKQINQQKETINNLNNDLSEYKQLKIKYQQLKTQLQQTEQLVAEHVKTQQKQQQKITTLQQQISGLESASAYMEDQLNQLQQYNQELQQENNQKNQILQKIDLIGTVNTIQSEINKLLHQHTQIQKASKDQNKFK